MGINLTVKLVHVLLELRWLKQLLLVIGISDLFLGSMRVLSILLEAHLLVGDSALLY